MTKEDSSVRIELGIDEVPTNFPTIQDFYKMSRIPDLHKFYENCMLMSIKSSNNQNIIDELPFWKFIILSKGLDKYLEAEAKQNGANTGTENEEMKNHMEGMRQNTSGMMNKFKSSMKTPNMKFK